MEKPTIWFLNRSDTNQTVQSQKQARSLKFHIQEEEELYYPSSENKGADQLRGYREADLRLCFRLCRLLVFSHGAAQMFDKGIVLILKQKTSVLYDNNLFCIPFHRNRSHASLVPS